MPIVSLAIPLTDSRLRHTISIGKEEDDRKDHKKGPNRMININKIIGQNISMLMQRKGKKPAEIAAALSKTTKDVKKMIVGEHTITAEDLQTIAAILEVSTTALTKIPAEGEYRLTLEAMADKAESRSAKEAIAIAGKVSDIVLFHKRVRENREKMMREAE